MADIQAVRDRDPACFSFVMAALYFKGFQALQCYRVAHWMWRSNRRVRCRVAVLATFPSRAQGGLC